MHDIPAPLPENWEVHPSHELLNKGPLFTCSKCLAVVKIAATSTSKVIQAPCQGLSRRSMGLNTQAHRRWRRSKIIPLLGYLPGPAWLGSLRHPILLRAGQITSRLPMWLAKGKCRPRLQVMHLLRLKPNNGRQLSPSPCPARPSLNKNFWFLKKKKK